MNETFVDDDDDRFLGTVRMIKGGKKRQRDIMLELLIFAVYCKHYLRNEMLRDEIHRFMYDDILETIASAKDFFARRKSSVQREGKQHNGTTGRAND